MARNHGSLAWPVTLDPAEEGGFNVNFPDFPEGFTQGDSREKALAQAADLLETMVANYTAEGWDLPAPSAAAGRPVMRLAPLVAAKAEVYRAMRAAGVSKAELARRAGVSPQQAQRLFDIHHASRLDQIDAALAALGRRLVVTTEAAREYSGAKINYAIPGLHRLTWRAGRRTTMFPSQARHVHSGSWGTRDIAFYPVGWEDTVGGVGRPQELINEDLRQCDYAFFVLHDRWGSPPGSGYTSGTEEEWSLAEELYQANKLRNIALFFKEVDPRQLHDPGPQLKMVLDFKKHIEEGKCYFFRQYQTVDQFAEILERLLARWQRDHERPARGLSIEAAGTADGALSAVVSPGFDYWVAEAEKPAGQFRSRCSITRVHTDGNEYSDRIGQ